MTDLEKIVEERKKRMGLTKEERPKRKWNRSIDEMTEEISDIFNEDKDGRIDILRKMILDGYDYIYYEGDIIRVKRYDRYDFYCLTGERIKSLLSGETIRNKSDFREYMIGYR